MNTKQRTLLSTGAALLFWGLARAASAASGSILKLDCYDSTLVKGGCDLCDFIILLVNIATFILGIAGSLALLFFIVGGFYWLTSAGNTSKVEAGKKYLVSSTVGLAIVFGAWMIVNFAIAALTGTGIVEGKKGVSLFTTQPWNEINCIKSPVPEVKKGAAVSGGGGGNCLGIATKSGVGKECADASSDLNLFLDCLIKNNTKGLPLTITSVSDSKYGFAGCVGANRHADCEHKPDSCHYGGGSHTNGSYAVDIRSWQYNTEQQVNDLQELINTTCKGTFGDERYKQGVDPHFHASAPGCRGTY